jgi:hypothetical protein
VIISGTVHDNVHTNPLVTEYQQSTAIRRTLRLACAHQVHDTSAITGIDSSTIAGSAAFIKDALVDDRVLFSDRDDYRSRGYTLETAAQNPKAASAEIDRDPRSGRVVSNVRLKGGAFGFQMLDQEKQKQGLQGPASHSCHMDNRSRVNRQILNVYVVNHGQKSSAVGLIFCFSATAWASAYFAVLIKVDCVLLLKQSEYRHESGPV